MTDHPQEALAFLLRQLPGLAFPSPEAEQATRDIRSEFCCHSIGELPIDSPFEFMSRSLRRDSRRHLLVCGAQGVGKSSLAKLYCSLATSGDEQHGGFDKALWLDCRNVGPDDTRGCWESIVTVCGGEDRILFALEGFASMLERPNGANNVPLVHALASFRNLRLLPIVSSAERSELIAHSPQLMSQMTMIEVMPPERGTVRKILLDRLKGSLAGVAIEWEDGFVDRLMSVADAYFINQNYPEKACLLLQHVIENAVFAAEQDQAGSITLSSDDLEQSVREMTGIAVHSNEKQPHVAIQQEFEQRVFGQPEAILACSRELEIIRSGLNDPGKPASVMMFAGTTGVGKTELAKAIAEVYSSSRKLHVYSMGNYSEPHSVSGIIGVPAGYVGHDDGGQLVNQLLADPFSVFLLDEAEKAHANVWKPFLNLFDEGWIVDQRGRKAYCEHSLFILTTNAGERTIQQMFRDQKPYAEITERVKDTLVRFRSERSSQPVFSQQFLARINEIVVFRPLTHKSLLGIATKLLDQIQVRYRQRANVELQVSDEVALLITDLAHSRNEQNSGKDGGRIVRRLIRQIVENRIVEHLRDQYHGTDNENEISLHLTVPGYVSGEGPASDSIAEIQVQAFAKI